MCATNVCAVVVLYFSYYSLPLCSITELLLCVFFIPVCLSDWLAKPLINQACLGKWAELRPNEGPDKACECVCVYARMGGFRQ